MINKKTISVEKHFTVKLHNKSEKNRVQVVNQEFNAAQKINYTFKGKKRNFYRKF